MQAHLRLEDGSALPVRAGMTIGRVAGNDVVIHDTKASRRHARIHFDAGVAEIEDLQSSNGTLLNGKPVERRVLRDGDVVRIGTTEIVFHEGAAPALARPAAPPSAGAAEVVAAPSAPAAPPVSPAAAAADDDDVDLFGDAPMESDDQFDGPPDDHLPPPPPGVIRVPLPPIEPRDPPPPARAGTVEFVDEVVEVKRVPVASPAVASPARSAGDPQIEKRQRVLQYSRNSKPGGVLADDLAQMNGLTKLLVVVVVLAAGVGIVWGLMTALR